MTEQRIDSSFHEENEKETVPDDEEVEFDTDLSAKIQRLQKRIQHMEFNIDQNVKRGEELSSNCYSLLTATEALAFDFVFAEYLLSNAPAQKVYDFLENCIHPKFNLSTGKQEDFEAATKYVQELQNLIQTTAQNLLKTDLQEKQIPKRTSEFVVFLRNQKAQLEQEINEDISATEPVSSREETTESSAQTERVDVDSPEFPQILSKWIQTELKLGSSQPQSQETIELRCLISSVSRRLANVTRLHKEITELKQQIIDTDQIDYNDCDASALINSPFFAGVKSSCNFLILCLQAMQEQQGLFDKFQKSLENCQAYLSTLSDRAQSAVQDMKKQLESLNEITSKKQEEIDQLKVGLAPFVEQIKQSPQKHNFADNESALKQYSVLEENLKSLSKDQPDSDAAKLQKVNDQIELVQKVRQQREELAKLCNEQSDLVDMIHEKIQVLFQLMAENKKSEEEALLSREETSLLEQFDSAISQAFDSLHLSEMAEWCKQLNGVGEQFRSVARSQQEIENQLKQYIAATEGGEENTARARQEIEHLSEENYAMALELGKAKLELEAAREEHFRAQQELEQFRDYLPECIDRRNAEQVKKYRAMVTCPLCKVNRRDTILSSCGHALCRSCVEKGQHLCPVCKSQFKAENVRPFFLQ